MIRRPTKGLLYMVEASGHLPLYNPADEALTGKRVGDEFGFKGSVLADLIRRKVITAVPVKPGEPSGKPRYLRKTCAAIRRELLCGNILLTKHADADFDRSPRPGDHWAPEPAMPPMLVAMAHPVPAAVPEVVATVIVDPWEDMSSALFPFGEVALHSALRDSPGSTVLTRIGSADAITLDQVRTLIAAATVLFEARR